MLCRFCAINPAPERLEWYALVTVVRKKWDAYQARQLAARPFSLYRTTIYNNP